MSEARRRTIAIVVPDMGEGGSVSAVALRHASELCANNRVILVSRSSAKSQPASVDFIAVHARKWNWLRRLCHVPNEMSFTLGVRDALQRLHQHTRLDVVWCHSHSTTALSATQLRELGVRLFMTTHGDIFDRPAGTYTNELAWYYRRVTPLAYRRADRVQVLSPAMRQRAVAGGALSQHVHLIPNGLDPSEIGLSVAPRARTAQEFLPRQVVRLLYVGSLWHVKGPDVLLRALRILCDIRGAGLSYEARYIGTGSPAKLKKLAVELQIENRVRFDGPQSRTSLSGSYADCDIVCVPSRSEALSTAALEAMMCSVPIVASRTGGLCAQVEDGVTGHLARPDDPADLARAILDAVQSREHLADMGRLGQVKVLRDFAWPQVGAQLQRMLDEAFA